MGQLVGFIIVATIYGLFWFLSNAAKQAQEKNAAELQRKVIAAKQQGEATRAEPKKKYRQIEQLHNRNADVSDPFVTAKTVSPPPLKRDSVFDEPIDGTSGQTASIPSAQQMSEHANPIAQEIMALMTTPQSMQQVVILSEIFNRPKSVSE